MKHIVCICPKAAQQIGEVLKLIQNCLWALWLFLWGVFWVGWVRFFFLLLFLHHTTQLHAFPRKELQSCSAATAMTSGVMTPMGCTKGFWDRSLLCICTGFSPWKMKKVIHPSCSSKLLSELEHKKIILFYSPVICPSLEKETPLR